MSETNFPVTVELSLNAFDAAFLCSYFSGYGLPDAANAFTAEHRFEAGKNFRRLYKLIAIEEKKEIMRKLEQYKNDLPSAKQELIEMLEFIKDNM